MLLHIGGCGRFCNDENHFATMYTADPEEIKEHPNKAHLDGSYEGFIKYYDDDVTTIDLRDKILVACESSHDYDSKETKIPIKIDTFFIDEGEKYGYHPYLIMAGHIAFLKIVRDSGEAQWFYKDDEPWPQTLNEFWKHSESATYDAKEGGFTKSNLRKQIKNIVRSLVDSKYNVKDENIIFLEGL